MADISNIDWLIVNIDKNSHAQMSNIPVAWVN